MEVHDSEPAATFSDKPVFTLSDTTCCEVPPRSISCLHQMYSAGSSETFYWTTRLHVWKRNDLYSHSLSTRLVFHLRSNSLHFSCGRVLPFTKTNRHDIGLHYTITGQHKSLASVGKKIAFPIRSFSVRSWDCPSPGLEISLSGPLSYRCETKHFVTSVSLHSRSWLSPRSPRKG